MNKTKHKENRLRANRNDKMHFMGQDCLRLHGGLRYTKSNSCVQCQKIIQAEFVARKKENGEVVYQGTTREIAKPEYTKGHVRFTL